MDDDADSKMILMTLPPENWNRAYSYHVAEHCPARSESLQPHTEWSSRPGSEPSYVEADVYIWCCALLVVHAGKEDTVIQSSTASLSLSVSTASSSPHISISGSYSKSVLTMLDAGVNEMNMNMHGHVDVISSHAFIAVCLLLTTLKSWFIYWSFCQSNQSGLSVLPSFSCSNKARIDNRKKTC